MQTRTTSLSFNPTSRATRFRHFQNLIQFMAFKQKLYQPGVSEKENSINHLSLQPSMFVGVHLYLFFRLELPFPMVIQMLLHMDETGTAPLINFSVCKCQAIKARETASKLFAFLSEVLRPFYDPVPPV